VQKGEGVLFGQDGCVLLTTGGGGVAKGAFVVKTLKESGEQLLRGRTWWPDFGFVEAVSEGEAGGTKQVWSVAGTTTFGGAVSHPISDLKKRRTRAKRERLLMETWCVSSREKHEQGKWGYRCRLEKTKGECTCFWGNVASLHTYAQHFEYAESVFVLREGRGVRAGGPPLDSILETGRALGRNTKGGRLASRAPASCLHWHVSPGARVSGVAACVAST